MARTVQDFGKRNVREVFFPLFTSLFLLMFWTECRVRETVDWGQVSGGVMFLNIKA